MAQIDIYTGPFCPYCTRAKSLLTGKDVPFTEHDTSRDPALRRQMIERAGGRTSVPQIFIDGRHIGGSDDLHALERRGELDRLLA